MNQTCLIILLALLCFSHAQLTPLYITCHINNDVPTTLDSDCSFNKKCNNVIDAYYKCSNPTVESLTPQTLFKVIYIFKIQFDVKPIPKGFVFYKNIIFKCTGPKCLIGGTFSLNSDYLLQFENIELYGKLKSLESNKAKSFFALTNAVSNDLKIDIKNADLIINGGVHSNITIKHKTGDAKIKNTLLNSPSIDFTLDSLRVDTVTANNIKLWEINATPSVVILDSNIVDSPIGLHVINSTVQIKTTNINGVSGGSISCDNSQVLFRDSSFENNPGLYSVNCNSCVMSQTNTVFVNTTINPLCNLN
jgi:hypothetical protein